jgi:hypothetical protein
MPCSVKCKCGAEKYFLKLNASQIDSFQCDECDRSPAEAPQESEQKQEAKEVEAEVSKKEKKKAKPSKE